MEVGCHHAEMNVICNAAANGVPTRGGMAYRNRRALHDVFQTHTSLWD